MNRMRKMLSMPRFMREHRWTRHHLSQHIDGELPPDEEARVREHLDGCSSCRKLLAALRRTVGGLGLLREPAPPDLADRVVTLIDREG